MDCRLVAFFSPETPRSCDRWNLASPGFGWRSLAASRFRALAGAPRRQPVPAPVLEAGEATSPLPDQSSVVANPDAHRGAQVLQRARGGPAFLHQGHRQDERVGHLRMALSSTCQKRLRPMSTQLSSVIIARTGEVPEAQQSPIGQSDHQGRDLGAERAGRPLAACERNTIVLLREASRLTPPPHRGEPVGSSVLLGIHLGRR